MPIDLERKQSIEELTNGRIKKRPMAEVRPARREKAAARPAAAKAVKAKR